MLPPSLFPTPDVTGQKTLSGRYINGADLGAAPGCAAGEAEVKVRSHRNSGAEVRAGPGGCMRLLSSRSPRRGVACRVDKQTLQIRKTRNNMKQFVDAVLRAALRRLPQSTHHHACVAWHAYTGAELRPASLPRRCPSTMGKTIRSLDGLGTPDRVLVLVSAGSLVRAQ